MASQDSSSKIRSIITFLLCVILLVAAFLSMRVISRKRSDALRAASKKERIATVRTGRVIRKTLRNVLTYNGDIQALHTVRLQPKISGRLLTLQLEDGTPVTEGVFVKAGQKLAQVDDRDFKAQVANARASKLASEAACSAAKASLEQKKNGYAAAVAATAAAQVNDADKLREWQRQQSLSSKHASTGQQLDKSRTEYDNAEANLRQAQADEQSAKAAIASAEAAIDQAKASLAQANARLDEALLNLDETIIQAPMDGFISHKNIDPGAMLSPTTEIVTIVELRRVKVLFSVPVNQLGNIHPGRTRATLRPPFEGAPAIDSVISKIYPAVNLATRTAEVELSVENPRDAQGNFLLRPGMYATIDVLVEERPDALVIDCTLPIRNLERQLVYRLKGDIATAVPVTLGIRSGELIEVTSGLSEGDEIVIQGQHRLTDGIQVKRMSASEAAKKTAPSP